MSCSVITVPVLPAEPAEPTVPPGADQKYTFVVRASTKLDLLKFFMQAAWEVKCLDQRKYAALAEPLNEIGKDIGSWQKFLQTKQPPSKG